MQLCATMLKSVVNVQRQYTRRDDITAASTARHVTTDHTQPGSSTPTDTPASHLLDQIMHVVHGCNQRLFVGFIDSSFRHACRPEHRWLVHLLHGQQCYFSCRFSLTVSLLLLLLLVVVVVVVVVVVLVVIKFKKTNKFKTYALEAN